MKLSLGIIKKIFTTITHIEILQKDYYIIAQKLKIYNRPHMNEVRKHAIFLFCHPLAISLFCQKHFFL